MPQYLLIERVNGVESEAPPGDCDAAMGSGIGPGSPIPRDDGDWIVVDVRRTDRGVELVIEREPDDPTPAA